MSLVQRIIIRTGEEKDVPSLLTGEMGWDYDKKTLRVGDNTNSPPRIPTTKSLGNFDFSSSTTWTLPNILQTNDATFNGMNLNSLNDQAGIVVRSSVAGQFTHTAIISENGSISIINGNGAGGSIDLSISDDLLQIIESFEGVVATYQATAPTQAKVGDLWMDSDNGILSIRCLSNSGEIWLDISSVGSGGIGHSAGSSAPVSPAVGDEWYNTVNDVLYKRVSNGSFAFWMQIS